MGNESADSADQRSLYGFLSTLWSASRSMAVCRGRSLSGRSGAYRSRSGRVSFSDGHSVRSYGRYAFVEDKKDGKMLAYTLSDRRMRNSYKFPFHSKCVAIDSRSGDFVWYVSSSNSNRETYETVVRTTRDGKVVAQGSPVEQLDSYSGMWQTLTLFHDTPEGMMAHHQFQPELFVVSDGSRQVMTLRFENHSFAPESFDWRQERFPRTDIHIALCAILRCVSDLRTSLCSFLCRRKNVCRSL